MQITTNEWVNIMLYVKEKLVEQLPEKKIVIVGTLQDLTLDSYLQAHNVKKERKKPVQTDDKFQEIWDAYPPSASFTYRGVTFTSSRVLRSNKSVCQLLYSKAIIESTVTHEQILAAIKKQVKMVKDESYESGQNRMQYLPALEVYLRQARYEAMIGIEDESEEETYTNNCA
jgi:hypothetical protein